MRLQQVLAGLIAAEKGLAAERAMVTLAIEALRGGHRFPVRRRRALSGDGA